MSERTALGGLYDFCEAVHIDAQLDRLDEEIQATIREALELVDGLEQWGIETFDPAALAARRRRFIEDLDEIEKRRAQELVDLAVLCEAEPA